MRVVIGATIGADAVAKTLLSTAHHLHWTTVRHSASDHQAPAPPSGNGIRHLTTSSTVRPAVCVFVSTRVCASTGTTAPLSAFPPHFPSLPPPPSALPNARWSPGDILNISIPTFEALAQFGTATIISKNTGTLEASYSLVNQSSPTLCRRSLRARSYGYGARCCVHRELCGCRAGFWLLVRYGKCFGDTVWTGLWSREVEDVRDLRAKPEVMGYFLFCTALILTPVYVFSNYILKLAQYFAAIIQFPLGDDTLLRSGLESARLFFHQRTYAASEVGFYFTILCSQF
ncbi:HAPLESS 2 protein [Nymphaea thermarum]|nr:HAPLESS 2 protein [Nymphaea thermarum]